VRERDAGRKERQKVDDLGDNELTYCELALLDIDQSISDFNQICGMPR